MNQDLDGLVYSPDTISKDSCRREVMDKIIGILLFISAIVTIMLSFGDNN